MYFGKTGRGFTLLEMLIVVVVLGLAVGLAAPRLVSVYQKRKIASDRMYIEDQMRELPRRVRQASSPMKISQIDGVVNLKNGVEFFHLPSGWRLVFKPELNISMLGVCSQSVMTAISTEDEEFTVQYNISTVSCELSALP